MTVDDSLARLRAGLDRDERAAQLALSAEWTISRPGQVVFRQGSTDTVIVRDGAAQIRDLEHMVRQDPKSTLLRVEAIRRVIVDRDCAASLLEPYAKAGVDTRAQRAVVRALDDVIEALASIYNRDES